MLVGAQHPHRVALLPKQIEQNPCVHTHTHTRACMHTQLLGGPIAARRTTSAPCARMHHSPANAQRCSQRAHGTRAITARALAVLARAGTQSQGTDMFMACTRVAAAHACNPCMQMQPEHAKTASMHMQLQHARAIASPCTCNHITTHTQRQPPPQHHSTHQRAIAAPTPCSPTHTPTRT